MQAMKSPSLASLTSSLGKFKQNLALIFWAMFFIMLAFEGLTVYGSVKVVTNQPPVPLPNNQNKGVRVNFNNYSEVTKRIQKAAGFAPEQLNIADPFSVPDPLETAPPPAQ